MSQVPARDPISEGWMNKGAPVDYIGRTTRSCPRCQGETTQDEYKVILGRHGGVGAPYFIKPFLKRSSTKGKVGTKSNWFVCANCGSMLPGDDTARRQAAEFMQPEGFIH